MTIREAFEGYFERWQRADGRLRSVMLHWDEQKRVVQLEHFRQVPELVDLDHPWCEDGIERLFWRPVPKDEHYDFAPLEKQWQITIPEAVKEYFNTYWFLDFGTWSGDEACEFFTEETCHILPVVPWEGLKTFGSQYDALCQTLADIGREDVQAVPIGYGVHGQLYVDCADEKVYAIHEERGACYCLSKDLASFIIHMHVPGVDSQII